jgi:hypothetical protein
VEQHFGNAEASEASYIQQQEAARRGLQPLSAPLPASWSPAPPCHLRSLPTLALDDLAFRRRRKNTDRFGCLGHPSP